MRWFGWFRRKKFKTYEDYINAYVLNWQLKLCYETGFNEKQSWDFIKQMCDSLKSGVCGKWQGVRFKNV